MKTEEVVITIIASKDGKIKIISGMTNGNLNHASIHGNDQKSVQGLVDEFTKKTEDEYVPGK